MPSENILNANSTVQCWLLNVMWSFIHFVIPYESLRRLHAAQRSISTSSATNSKYVSKIICNDMLVVILPTLPYPSSVVESLELPFARSPNSMMNPATTSSSETWPIPSWSCATQFGNGQRRSKRSWYSILSIPWPLPGLPHIPFFTST